ncbi:MAG: hypothetical protein SW833_25675 [Cyanobacteriota bacterium]|nr:hypothetical protein [Cyanobacteriota bacterium]
MNTVQFLGQLNDAEKGWGLWVDRNNIEEHHVGQYAFENDRMPKSFAHVASLDNLAHQRQTYIANNSSSGKSEETLGHEWAEQFIAAWKSQPVEA